MIRGQMADDGRQQNLRALNPDSRGQTTEDSDQRADDIRIFNNLRIREMGQNGYISGETLRVFHQS